MGTGIKIQGYSSVFQKSCQPMLPTMLSVPEGHARSKSNPSLSLEWDVHEVREVVCVGTWLWGGGDDSMMSLTS